MADFHTYSPEDVINANLLETATRFDRVCEQELAHLRELASEILATGGELTDLIAALPDHAPTLSHDLPSDTLLQNSQSLEGVRHLRNTWHRVLLCLELQRQISATKALTPEYFFPDTETVPSNAYNRIVYQRSSYTDSAYLQFAPLLSMPRASYAHSFPSACEDVYNGLCEFCILPVENTSEGQLNSFFRLMERYELKIAATCDVTGTDASRTTRFALLRRNLTPLLRPRDGRQFLELTAPTRGVPSTADLLLAAQLCGMRLHRLDTLPYHEEELPSTRFTFLTEGGHLPAFLLYLAMDLPHYNPMGIYSHLSP